MRAVPGDRLLRIMGRPSGRGEAVQSLGTQQVYQRTTEDTESALLAGDPGRAAAEAVGS